MGASFFSGLCKFPCFTMCDLYNYVKYCFNWLLMTDVIPIHERGFCVKEAPKVTSLWVWLKFILQLPDAWEANTEILWKVSIASLFLLRKWRFQKEWDFAILQWLFGFLQWFIGRLYMYTFYWPIISHLPSNVLLSHNYPQTGKTLTSQGVNLHITEASFLRWPLSWCCTWTTYTMRKWMAPPESR